jgi:hypothetical protein
MAGARLSALASTGTSASEKRNMQERIGGSDKAERGAHKDIAAAICPDGRICGLFQSVSAIASASTKPVKVNILDTAVDRWRTIKFLFSEDPDGH